MAETTKNVNVTVDTKFRRQRALELALEYRRDFPVSMDAEATVAVAEKFYDFLSSKDES